MRARRGAPWEGVTSVLLLLAVALLVLAALLVATGHQVAPALGALARGAFGSGYAITSATLVRAIPLALAGVAVTVAFRGGVLNVGAEGQLLAGAAAACALASWAPAGAPAWVMLPALLATGALAGGVWGAIPGWLRLRYAVLEVISTIMLNFVALAVVGWLVRGPLQEPTRINPQSASLPSAWQLPVLVPGTRLHAGALLAVAAAVGCWWWLARSAAGFRLRAVGANPQAAASAGEIAVGRTLLGAFEASGALAGVAGAVEYAGVTYALYENFSPGYGYTAIAVALLARLSPVGVLGTALIFGALSAGGSAMQRDAGVPSVVVNVVEATLILLVLAAGRWRGGPGAARSAETGT